MGKKINFSANTQAVFSAMGTDYESMNHLMQDLALGREIFDEESQRMISKADANAKVLDFSRQVLAIGNVRDRQEVRRGLRDHGREWLDIIEDTVDLVITTGLQENEWFNTFVDSMTIGYGDRADFYSEEESILSVAKSGESHHDHILQRIAAGQTVPVPTFRHVVKIGADINRFILGDVDWAKMIQAVARAFVLDTQTEAYSALDSAVSKLPVTTGFVETGALSAATKAQFDRIIANVQAANDGAEVSIFGTQVALKKITALADVNWANTAQKDAMANSGIIGIYEGTPLVVLPQRFKDRNMNAMVFDDKKLFIMPMVENKFVKFIDEGVTEINEITDKGEQNGRWDDIMTYEVQRRYGVAVMIGRYFGQWTLR